jgi:hypothetical protein
MYATIQVSPYVHVQGEVMRELPNGAVVIRLGERDYVGRPLTGVKPTLRTAS